MSQSGLTEQVFSSLLSRASMHQWERKTGRQQHLLKSSSSSLMPRAVRKASFSLSVPLVITTVSGGEYDVDSGLARRRRRGGLPAVLAASGDL